MSKYMDSSYIGGKEHSIWVFFSLDNVNPFRLSHPTFIHLIEFLKDVTFPELNSIQAITSLNLYKTTRIYIFSHIVRGFPRSDDKVHAI